MGIEISFVYDIIKIKSEVFTMGISNESLEFNVQTMTDQELLLIAKDQSELFSDSEMDIVKEELRNRNITFENSDDSLDNDINTKIIESLSNIEKYLHFFYIITIISLILGGLGFLIYFINLLS